MHVGSAPLQVPSAWHVLTLSPSKSYPLWQEYSALLLNLLPDTTIDPFVGGWSSPQVISENVCDYTRLSYFKSKNTEIFREYFNSIKQLSLLDLLQLSANQRHLEISLVLHIANFSFILQIFSFLLNSSILCVLI